MGKRLKLSDSKVSGYLSGEDRKRRRDKFYYYKRRDMEGSSAELEALYRRLILLRVGDKLIHNGYEYWIENNRYYRRIYKPVEGSDSIASGSSDSSGFSGSSSSSGSSDSSGSSSSSNL
jgi:uncharacterized membrane protein YgcG